MVMKTSGTGVSPKTTSTTLQSDFGRGCSYILYPLTREKWISFIAGTFTHEDKDHPDPQFRKAGPEPQIVFCRSHLPINCIVKACLVRSVSTSAAAAAGIREVVFQRVYQKLTRSNQFGMAVLQS